MCLNLRLPWQKISGCPKKSHSATDRLTSNTYSATTAMLPADAFELFEKNGIFDPKTAKKFKETILETGDTEDPMVLFQRFRGHKPDAHALLRLRGFE
ncbi:MAG: hypothetical protein J1E95_12430 [Muribaculaceae bacterium]|nr:hypothetical protein [Muribaculaceae bacterium]